MARPRPPLHPLEAKLATRLSPGTVTVYGRIARRIDESGLTAEAWLEAECAGARERARLAQRADAGMPQRTLTVLRAAVAWYVAEIEAPGTGRSAVTARLPSAKPLWSGVQRDEFTDAQLAAWNAAADREIEPHRTILLLLPLTALRIHEATGLLDERCDAGARTMTITGKGGRTRVVPLSARAADVLASYRRAYAPHHGFVFARYVNESGQAWMDGDPRACKPRDVWRAVERMRATPGLENVVIHQTRHTTASRLLRTGADIAQIRDITGHKSTATLERYLHTTLEDRRAALDRI